MTQDCRAQVLVVGAGPAGLVLCLCLLKMGIPVRIIDKESVVHQGERGNSATPRTLELERFLGIYDDIEATGEKWPMMWNAMDPDDPNRITASFSMTEEVEPTPSMPITRGIAIGQCYHQAILRKHIEAIGGVIELGTTLIELEESASDVRAKMIKTVGDKAQEECAAFKYVVGADGARSFVRKEMGIDFIGDTHEGAKLYLVDAEVDGIGPQRGFTAYGDTTSEAVIFLATIKPKMFQVVCRLSEDAFARIKTAGDSLDGVKAEIRRVTKHPGITLKNSKWHSEWRANIRIASAFSKGRIFIVGDAAHTHSPTGGQGMNSSVQDSFNLAWKLALVLKNASNPSLLESYNEERRPVIAEMLNLTTALFKKTFYGEKMHEGEVGDKTFLARERGLMRGRNMAQLDVNYRWSSVVFDERSESGATRVDGSGNSEKNAYGTGGQALRAGDRAPDAPDLECLKAGESFKPVSRLFDILTTTKHTALIFAGTSYDGILRMLDALRAIPKGNILKVVIIPAESPHLSEAANRLESDVDFVLRDTKQYAQLHYDALASGPSVVVVRPDAIVGAYALSAACIQRYIRAVFA